MIYRSLKNGDYLLGGGDGEFLGGVKAVAQAIITRIKLLLNEWWENLNEGTPLWENILGNSGKDIESVDKIIINRILGTEGVLRVKDYESSFDVEKRTYSFKAIVDTVYGESILEETL